LLHSFGHSEVDCGHVHIAVAKTEQSRGSGFQIYAPPTELGIELSQTRRTGTTRERPCDSRAFMPVRGQRLQEQAIGLIAAA
jgi:hypothetical protein